MQDERARKMARQVKMPVAKLDSLSSTPWALTVKREPTPLAVLCTHTHTPSKTNSQSP